MVALNNVFISVAALPLALGAAVPAQTQVKEASIFSRQDSWDEYDQTTASFAEQGLCRRYLDPTSRDGLETCRIYCPDDSPSITCNGNANDDPSTRWPNPDGERWTPGECWCENAFIEALVDFTVLGLAEVGKVTCAVWMEAGKFVVDHGTWLIPGVGPTANAAKNIIRSVGAAGKIGGKENWQNFVGTTCGLDDYDFDLMSEVFEIVKDAPPEAAE